MGIGLSGLDSNGIEVTNLYADPAANAGLVVDMVNLPAFSSDRFDRAVAGADHAAGTARLDLHAYQRLADFRGAMLLVDMGFILVAEVTERADDRDGCALAEPAQTVACDFIAQVLQPLDIAFLAFAVADFLQQLEDAARSDTAGRAFPARFGLREIHEVAGNVDHAGGLVHDDQPA